MGSVGNGNKNNSTVAAAPAVQKPTVENSRFSEADIKAMNNANTSRFASKYQFNLTDRDTVSVLFQDVEIAQIIRQSGYELTLRAPGLEKNYSDMSRAISYIRKNDVDLLSRANRYGRR